MELFEVKVAHRPNGESEVKKEVYLVNAVSFTEAEWKVIDELGKYSVGEVKILAEKKSRVENLLYENVSCDESEWWRGRIAMLVSGEGEDEKWKVAQFIVRAKSFGVAYERLKDEVKKYMCDCEVVGLVKTSIVDLID